jgi:hypothetical protein
LDDAGSESGHVESVDGTEFIFIKPELWVAGRDIVPTFIHELLHIVYPNASEAEVRSMEWRLCKQEGILMEDFLEG